MHKKLPESTVCFPSSQPVVGSTLFLQQRLSIAKLSGHRPAVGQARQVAGGSFLPGVDCEVEVVCWVWLAG